MKAFDVCRQVVGTLFTLVALGVGGSAHAAGEPVVTSVEVLVATDEPPTLPAPPETTVVDTTVVDTTVVDTTEAIVATDDPPVPPEVATGSPPTVPVVTYVSPSRPGVVMLPETGPNSPGSFFVVGTILVGLGTVARRMAGRRFAAIPVRTGRDR